MSSFVNVINVATFLIIRYLGSSLVDQPTGEESTSKAIKTISAMVKKQDRKLERVALTISLRGIKMETIVTSSANLDFSIYRWILVGNEIDTNKLNSGFPIAPRTQRTTVCLPSSPRARTRLSSVTHSSVLTEKWPRQPHSPSLR